MKRALLAVALVVGLFGMIGVNSSLDAQAKKDPVPKAKAGTVEIYKGKAGMRWRVVDAEGKTIAMPPPAKHWDKREDVLKEIDELKEALKTKPVDVKE
jgi:hypothetical protein